MTCQCHRIADLVARIRNHNYDPGARSNSGGNPIQHGVHIDRKDVPHLIRDATDYSGCKWLIEPAKDITIRDAHWDGGTRSYYKAVDLATGKSRSLSVEAGNPITHPEAVTVEIPMGFVVIKRKYFRGRDLGVTIIVHPENIAPLLPEKPEITWDEAIVLAAARGLISKYKNFRRDEAVRTTGITVDEYDYALAGLQHRKMLGCDGRISQKGRNAVGYANLDNLHRPEM